MKIEGEWGVRGVCTVTINNLQLTINLAAVGQLLIVNRYEFNNRVGRGKTCGEGYGG
jgi:hypothetical protein